MRHNGGIFQSQISCMTFTKGNVKNWLSDSHFCSSSQLYFMYKLYKNNKKGKDVENIFFDPVTVQGSLKLNAWGCS